MSLPNQRIEITETTTAYCGYTIKAVYDAAFNDWEWFVEKTNDPDSDYATGGEFDNPEDAITDAKKWIDRRLTLTQLLAIATSDHRALEGTTDETPLAERKALYRAAKESLKDLTAAMDKAVPFELMKGGQAVGTVRVRGGITSPGIMLNYSDTADSQYCFKGRSLLAVDEIRVIED